MPRTTMLHTGSSLRVACAALALSALAACSSSSSGDITLPDNMGGEPGSGGASSETGGASSSTGGENQGGSGGGATGGSASGGGDTGGTGSGGGNTGGTGSGGGNTGGTSTGGQASTGGTSTGGGDTGGTGGEPGTGGVGTGGEPSTGGTSTGGGDTGGSSSGGAGTGGEPSTGGGDTGGSSSGGAGTGGDPGTGGAGNDAVCGDGVVEAGEACDSGLSACCNATCTGPSQGDLCRPVAGVCDVEEFCNGVDFECPADVKATSDIACRFAADACDLEEVCDGGDDCPADVHHCSELDIGSSVHSSSRGSNDGTCDFYQPSCAVGGDEQVFLFTAPETASYQFDTFLTGFDTVLYAFEGLACGAAELACSDDVGGLQSGFVLYLTQGQQITVVVEGASGEVGDIDLSVGLVACGDGIVNGAEACDDENLDDGDGCSSVCTVELPAGWMCPEDWYGDEECDCGCGVLDFDCPNATAGVCSYHVCPGLQEPVEDENYLCEGGVGGPAPPEWTCLSGWYGDGTYCDCGCGVVDFDCPDATSAWCDWDDCGDGVPDPEDNASCVEPG